MWERQRNDVVRSPRPLEFHAVVVKPVVDSSMRGLCIRKYPNHPYGCPNYGQRDTCPPAAPRFKDAFDTEYAIWALWTEFDLGAHREKMWRKHPKWSERQLVNCRHWQGGVRKFLRAEADKWVEKYAAKHPKCRDIQGFLYTECPEAMGVNVTATMQNVGVNLEWPPKETTRLIYLAGVQK